MLEMANPTVKTAMTLLADGLVRFIRVAWGGRVDALVVVSSLHVEVDLREGGQGQRHRD